MHAEGSVASGGCKAFEETDVIEQSRPRPAELQSLIAALKLGTTMGDAKQNLHDKVKEFEFKMKVFLKTSQYESLKPNLILENYRRLVTAKSIRRRMLLLNLRYC